MDVKSLIICVCVYLCALCSYGGFQYDSTLVTYTIDVLHDVHGHPTGEHTLAFHSSSAPGYTATYGNPGGWRLMVSGSPGGGGGSPGGGWNVVYGSAPHGGDDTPGAAYGAPAADGTYAHNQGASQSEFILSHTGFDPCPVPTVPVPTHSLDGGAGHWEWSTGFCVWSWLSNWHNPATRPDYDGGPTRGEWIFDYGLEIPQWVWTGIPHGPEYAWSDTWPWVGGGDNWPDELPLDDDGLPIIGGGVVLTVAEAETIAAINAGTDQGAADSVALIAELQTLVGDEGEISPLDTGTDDAPDITVLGELETVAMGTLTAGGNSQASGAVGDLIVPFGGLLGFGLTVPALASSQDLIITLPGGNVFGNTWPPVVCVLSWPIGLGEIKPWLEGIVTIVFFFALINLLFKVFGSSGSEGG